MLMGLARNLGGDFRCQAFTIILDFLGQNLSIISKKNIAIFRGSDD